MSANFPDPPDYENLKQSLWKKHQREMLVEANTHPFPTRFRSRIILTNPVYVETARNGLKMGVPSQH